MTDQNGSSLETSEYLPFGSSRTQSGTVQSAYKYTDQEHDAETGLYNYDARLYDPVIGRFITADTIVPDPYFPQTMNRYSYCYNNPLIYVDPTGHISWESAPTATGENFNDGGYYNNSSSESSGNGNNEESTTAAGVAVTAGRLGKARTVAAGVGTAGVAGVGVMAAGMVLGMPSNTIVTEKEELEMLSKAQESLNLDESDDDGQVEGESGGEEAAEGSTEGTEASRQKGDRWKSGSDANEQYKEIKKAQDRAKKGRPSVKNPESEWFGGKRPKQNRINSTRKSKNRKFW